MKLDTRALRYLTPEDWRVLTAVEQGSKNHEIVSTSLIVSISHLRGGSTSIHKSISTLAKAGLIAKLKNAKYDGYRLTYGGLDYLALHTHRQTGALYSVGNQIGVGKESDIYVCAPPPPSNAAASSQSTPRILVVKIHRLGRISFRTVKANRDYLRHRTTGSWQYLSRLAAQKEYSIMRALHSANLSVPQPIAHSRHTIVMEFIDAFPLRQISRVPDPAALYAELIQLILRLAAHGLIHGDFNEFNSLIREDPDPAPFSPSSSTDTAANSSPPQKIKLTPILIDFPQTLSIDHPNAAEYFARDVNCIKRFFSRRYGFIPAEEGPFFADALRLAAEAARSPATGNKGARRLDVEVEASGFSRKMAKELEAYMKDVGPEREEEDSTASSGGGESEDEEERDDGVVATSSNNNPKTTAEDQKPQPSNPEADTARLVPGTDSGTVNEVSRWNLESLESQLDALESAPEVLDARVVGKPVKRSGKAAAGWAI